MFSFWVIYRVLLFYLIQKRLLSYFKNISGFLLFHLHVYFGNNSLSVLLLLNYTSFLKEILLISEVEYLESLTLFLPGIFWLWSDARSAALDEIGCFKSLEGVLIKLRILIRIRNLKRISKIKKTISYGTIFHESWNLLRYILILFLFSGHMFLSPFRIIFLFMNRHQFTFIHFRLNGPQSFKHISPCQILFITFLLFQKLLKFLYILFS